MTDGIEILKQAILLEKRGMAFYRQVAAQTGSEAVKTFFNRMADEEQRHIELLSTQFRAFQQGNHFVPGTYPKDEAGGLDAAVLTEGIRGKISAAGFEAAAVSAAMAMEQQAVKLYADRAASATDLEEKALYRWLSEWETRHLEILAALDRQLTEAIWHDNSFWPF
jgi:rubrerythrin